MENNRDYEQEIFFKDLIFHLLYRWRSLVAAALIGAALLGGFQYLRVHGVIGGQTAEEIRAEVDKYENSVAMYENNIEAYTTLIRQNNEYTAGSVYLRLDPQNVWICARSFYVKLDAGELAALAETGAQSPADYVAAAYASALKSGLDEAEMEALMGTSRREYIDELVTVTPNDPVANPFTIQIVGPDRETVERQMDYFVSRLENECAQSAQAVAAHTLVPVSANTTVGTDANLSALRESLSKKGADYQTKLADSQKNLAALVAAGHPAASGGHLKRYIAFGFVGGAGVLALVYVLAYLLGGRLHAASEMATRFGLPVYGAFASHRARRPGFGIDKWLDRREFAGQLTDPDVIFANVCALLKENFAGKRVLLAGAADEQRLAPVADKLRAGTDGAVEIALQAGFLRAGDGVAAARQADGVLLAVEKYRDGIEDIDRMAETLSIARAKVAGCVVL